MSQQYNHFHRVMWDNECLDSVECNYIPYRDTGLFGFYGVADDSGLSTAVQFCVRGAADSATKFWEWEYVLARNKLFQEMLSIQENTNDTFNQMAQQLVYLDRRVSNLELAKRITSVSADDLQNVCNN